MTRKEGEGANQINMDVGESGNGKRNGSRPKMSMAVHFRSLAGKAGMAPEGKHPWPSEARRNGKRGAGR